eukprot:Blabericola_migrator_1__942@NODE_1235_length_5022_cov_105_462563_g453_i3_p2_GENE_NODE_1235_length_5022_cov_105_462563_g453_i3NODE_1235_length_5022_cov_105_462563_g453_i3_p2_ORF_typecomplete_len289_score63_92SecDTM1/PF13721_6/5_9e02SecDTM1/PF13721_6/1_9e03SecDTM1/PF13721_6/0_071GerD/PF17898_1/10GerD/PF17898_1/0_65FAM75/PF14650_6/0_099Virul_fac_BrkB/PF03631_15/1_8e03Virul_fac_BrkB/PF03631_15/0_34PSCyt2/PF07583_11/5_5PSCyt2/PF07583_11/76_NODE_1235_length_5022_cov_105_462563_g453_i38301696
MSLIKRSHVQWRPGFVGTLFWTRRSFALRLPIHKSPAFIGSKETGLKAFDGSKETIENKRPQAIERNEKSDTRDGRQSCERGSLKDDLKFFTFIVALGLALYGVLELVPLLKKQENLLAYGVSKLIRNQALQKALIEDVRDFIKAQGPALRETLVKDVLDQKELNEVVLTWAIKRAKECCAAPEVVKAMGDLITSAVEMPETQAAVAKSLKEILNSAETKRSALDFVGQTLSQPQVEAQVAQVSKAALQAMVNDTEVQSNAWQFLKRSLLPRWGLQELLMRSRKDQST